MTGAVPSRVLPLAWALAWSGALAGSGEGQDDARPSQLEERVEVRAELPLHDDVAAFATTIYTDGIVARGQDLADVLRRVPGARVRDYGGLGRYSTVSLRGSTSEQVTVLVDGVPQNRALGGPVDLSSIPATQIERVTVFRGFGPASLGLGGIGGVVDVRTRAPDDKPLFRADLLAGELNTQRGSADLSVRTDPKGTLRVGLEVIHSDGDFEYLDPGVPFESFDDTRTQRRNNDVQQAALLLQHVRSVGGDGRLRLAARTQQRERGVPGVDTQQSDTARLDESLDDFTGSWTSRGGETLAGADVIVDLFRQRIHYQDLDGNIGIGSQDQVTRLDGGGAAGVLRVTPGLHRLLFRLDARQESADVRDDAKPVADRGGADRHRFSLTTEDVRTFGRFTLAPTLRWEHLRDSFRGAGDGTLPPLVEDSRDGAWSGKLGVAFRASATWTVRGSAGSFLRFPSLLEMFGDRGAVVGNPTLRPERARSLEIGGAGRGKRERSSWSFEGVAFARRTEDLIRLIATSQAVSRPSNIADADVWGLEASATWSAPYDFALEASGTLQQSEETSGLFAGNSLPYQPDRLGYVGASWKRSFFQIRWEVTYVGENFIDRPNTPELQLPARVMHDLQLAFRVARGLELGLDVRNIFDRETRDVSRYPLPGRVVLFHIGWNSAGRRS